MHTLCIRLHDTDETESKQTLHVLNYQVIMGDFGRLEQLIVSKNAEQIKYMFQNRQDKLMKAVTAKNLTFDGTKLEVDQLSDVLLPSKYEHLSAFKAKGDGNCLYNAASLCAVGENPFYVCKQCWSSFSLAVRNETSYPGLVWIWVMKSPYAYARFFILDIRLFVFLLIFLNQNIL